MRQKILCILVCVYVGVLFLIICVSADRNTLFTCHDDPTFEPRVGPIRELQFTWLGTLQYIHIKNGTPHYFRVPRVVLVSKQYTLCAAHDATPVPRGYALGNVVFGEYERDEDECGLTVDQIAGGMPCEPVMLLMPIADVMVHPEYGPLASKPSIALLKLLTPVVSKYMIPVCLPLCSYLEKKEDQRVSSETMYHIDYQSPVPRAFADELKKITVVTALPDELCNPSDFRGNDTWKKQICTSGCGFHSGAPSIIHERTGHWTLVALSLGGSWCSDPLIYRPSPPPRHLLIFPYLYWITQIVTGKPPRALRLDPFGEIVPRVTHYKRFETGWVGHWWLGGVSCYDRGLAAAFLFRFYHEIFTLDPKFVTNLTYYIEFYAPNHVYVKCVKVGMPIQLAKPRVWHLHTPTPKKSSSETGRFEVKLLTTPVNCFEFGLANWGAVVIVMIWQNSFQTN